MAFSPTPESKPSAASRSTSIPLWRNERVVKIAMQALFLIVVLAAFTFFYNNALRGLRETGLTPSFRFLSSEAGFSISEGIRYQPSDPYSRALLVGLANTVRVSLVGIVVATIIGIVVGIARLSSNWLVRNIAKVYVEVFRNVPLLLQLLFWYSAVFLKLPPVRQALSVYDHIFLSQRGLYVPRLIPTETTGIWLGTLAVGLFIAGAVYVHRLMQLRRADRPGFPMLRAAPAFLLVAIVGWLLVPEVPVTMEVPELQRFNFVGGMRLSPEFAALLFGLSIYTGAFIAEVVRGAIQAVDKGQREAALALGLRPGAVMYLVVLPQALRIIIPPLTSQYLNLVKNSSLAVAIGYPELFNVGTTAMNQTGQTLPLFLLIMGSYLALSLVTSTFMNWYNKRMRLIER